MAITKNKGLADFS